MSNLIVMTFDNAAEAGEVRRALGRLERQGLLDLEDAAVVVRAPDGEVRVDNEVSSGVKVGAFGGALVGGLVTFLFPALGIVAGAAAGALGAKALHRGVDQSFVEEVSAALQPGTSALFLVVNAARQDAALAALQPHRGRVYHTTLDPEAEASLRRALGEPQGQPGADSAGPAGGPTPATEEPPASFPQDHVLGVIDRPEEAERAAQALRDAGIDAGDVHLIPSQQAHLVEENLRRRHPVLHGLQEWLLGSNVGEPADAYLRAARGGGNILAVRIRDKGQVDLVGRILAQHHGYLLRYFSAWSTAVLPTQ